MGQFNSTPSMEQWKAARDQQEEYRRVQQKLQEAFRKQQSSTEDGIIDLDAADWSEVLPSQIESRSE